MTGLLRSIQRVAVIALTTSVLCGVTLARIEPMPEEMKGVRVDENLGAILPLDIPFENSFGETVALGDYVNGDRPAILVLAYYRCPMLCTLVLNGLTDTLKQIQWTAGQEFDVITVSIDPNESRQLAVLKKQHYLREYKRPSAKKGWHFLTGSAESIAKLADTVGFRYKEVPEKNQFAHAASIYMISPKGKITRYLYGVRFERQTVRLSLVEASDGKIGSTIDRILLTCFHYDAVAGEYTLAALNLMRIAGALTVLLLGSLIAVYWRRENRRRKLAVGMT